MDSDQDVILCYLCKSQSVIVYCYCDTCDVYLCKPCIGKHLSDENVEHEIVPIKHQQSTLVFPNCGTHQNKKCVLQCKNCNKVVCSSCMASKQHMGHIFEEVAEVHKLKNIQILQTYRTVPQEKTDRKSFWSEPILSVKLKDLFKSFKIEFPEDPLNESFVREILNENLVTEIKSLSDGIVLIKDIHEKNQYEHGNMAAVVFEIDVVSGDDQYSVVIKVNIKYHNHIITSPESQLHVLCNLLALVFICRHATFVYNFTFLFLLKNYKDNCYYFWIEASL